MIDPYERIYALVREIPPGRVTTYGQLAAMCGISDSRLVGEAMNASHDVPWQRVINSKGEISIKGATGSRQRELLEREDVGFDASGRVDLALYGWSPEPEWLLKHGYRLPPPLVKEKSSKAKAPPDEEGDQLTLF